MQLHIHKQALIALAHYCFLVCVAPVGTLLVGSLVKGVALLAFALLLLFVVGRSAKLWKVVTTCFRALPVSSFALFTNPRWAQSFAFAFAIPAEPCLAPRYQRPPPFLSF